MVVDDQESYSTGLADIVQAKLKADGVNVDRESISQKSTDFSSLVAKVSSSTKVVFLPFQLASEAQLFAQQLKSQGKSAVVFGSDGTFDSSKFNASGNYVSFFAPDVTTIKADAAIVAAYHKQFPGGTSPFGAPNYVLAQMYATAAVKACGGSTKGTISRASMRAAFAKVKLPTTILGTPVSFTSNGDRRRCQVPHLQDRERQVRHSRVVRRIVGARQPPCPHGLSPDELEPLRHRARLRDRPRMRLRPDRPRLLDGVRDPEAAELRPRRHLHGGRVHRLRRAHDLRRRALALDPDLPAALLHVLRRDARRRPARGGDRALRLQAAA